MQIDMNLRFMEGETWLCFRHAVERAFRGHDVMVDVYERDQHFPDPCPFCMNETPDTQAKPDPACQEYAGCPEVLRLSDVVVNQQKEMKEMASKFQNKELEGELDAERERSKTAEKSLVQVHKKLKSMEEELSDANRIIALVSAARGIGKFVTCKACGKCRIDGYVCLCGKE